MQFTDDIWPIVRGHGWKYQGGRIDISGAIIHATRSGIPNRPAWLEYNSAVNWMKSEHNFVDVNGIPAGAGGNPNAKWYGGMSSVIIGGGKTCHVMPDEMVPRFSAGTHDFRALSIEMGQGTINDRYDDKDIDLLWNYLNEKSVKYVFPITRIPFVDGANRGWPGLVGHEDTAQGKGQGKSDPGAIFWQQFMEAGKFSMEDRELLYKIADAVCRTGIDATCYPNTAHLFPPGTPVTQEGQWPPTPGSTVRLTGDNAVEYSHIRGFSFALGLRYAQFDIGSLKVEVSNLQERVGALEAPGK